MMESKIHEDSTLIILSIFLSHPPFFLNAATAPQWAMASSFLRFLYHTQRTIVSRSPLDEWSAGRRDLYLTTHNTHNRQISMSPAGFEPTISAGERPQTDVLDRADTGRPTSLPPCYTQIFSTSPFLRPASQGHTHTHTHTHVGELGSKGIFAHDIKSCWDVEV